MSARDNVAQGRKAQSSGKLVEGIFKRAFDSIGVPCTRIPNGCRQVGVDKRTGRPILVREKSPWDFVVTHRTVTALLDTKTSDHNTFRYSNIDANQVEKMLPHVLQGGRAGYVVWLRELAQVYFIDARALNEKIGQRGAFAPGDPGMVLLGTLTEFPLKGALRFGAIFRDKPVLLSEQIAQHGLTHDEVMGRVMGEST